MSRQALLALPYSGVPIGTVDLTAPGEGSGPNQSRRSIRTGLQLVPPGILPSDLTAGYCG